MINVVFYSFNCVSKIIGNSELDEYLIEPKVVEGIARSEPPRRVRFQKPTNDLLRSLFDAFPMLRRETIVAFYNVCRCFFDGLV